MLGNCQPPVEVMLATPQDRWLRSALMQLPAEL
jgi:hypothetical protein